MYFSISIPLPKLRQSKILTLESLGYKGNIRELRTQVEGTTFYILLGRVYGQSHKDLKSLTEKFESNQKFSGRYLLLKIETQLEKISFWTDKYRLLSPAISVNSERFWIGNCPTFFPTDLTERDLVSEQSLSEMGAIPYPRTLFKNLQLVTGNGVFKNELSMTDHAEEWPREYAGLSVGQWVDTFKRSLNNILREFGPEYFRISGGLDTRLIAFALPKEDLSRLKAEVLCHPQLEDSEDHDVMGAKMVANALDFPLISKRLPIEKYNYVGEADGRILSGLYGGEFLGGLLHEFSPVKKVLDFPPSAARDLWQDRENKIGERALQVELFLSTFRSTIYCSHRDNSWSNPWLLHMYCFSPFVEEEMIDNILRTPYEELMNYSLYAKIFKSLVGEKAQLPLVSPVTFLQGGIL